MFILSLRKNIVKKTMHCIVISNIFYQNFLFVLSFVLAFVSFVYFLLYLLHFLYLLVYLINSCCVPCCGWSAHRHTNQIISKIQKVANGFVENVSLCLCRCADNLNCICIC
jgi:hypothetical protein